MNVSGGMAMRMLGRGFRNVLRKKPLSISFEVTHSCTANCWHCNWGGGVKEDRLEPAGYGRICEELSPVVSHVSGGEPLIRADVYEIVDAMTHDGDLPWMIVVSNCSTLDEDKFFRLKEAGMHQLSVSLDFPDERHSEFRRIPGLFERMDELLPKLAARTEHDDILLNVCITAWNYETLPEIVKLADHWGLPVNFSVYTHLRVQDRSGLVQGEELDDLEGKIREVIDLKKEGYPVYTSPRVMWKYHRFLTEESIPDCKAGERFLVINPDGRLTPCAMVMAYFDSQEEMYEEFTKQNECTKCYISTRANTEKTFMEFVQDNTHILEKALPWK